MHDAGKVLLGGGQANNKWVSRHEDDPANFPAGRAVSLKSNGLLSLNHSDGEFIGISLGNSLSDHKETSVVRAGLLIPIEVEPYRARAGVTIDDYTLLLTGGGDSFTIAGVTFVAQAGAVTPGQATFRAATSNEATKDSLIAQINAHAVASVAVFAIDYATDTLVIGSNLGGTVGNLIDISYTDDNSDGGITIFLDDAGFLAGGSDDPLDLVASYDIGTQVYINNQTGKMDILQVPATTITKAVLVTWPLTGVNESGVEVPAALIDMQGGL